jgi:hypothetical protein
VFNQKLTSNAIANFYQDLLAFLASVTKMIFMSMFLTIFCISSINGQELPDQKFVTDLVTNFNRFGIIYHLPLMKLSHVQIHQKIQVSQREKSERMIIQAFNSNDLRNDTTFINQRVILREKVENFHS